MDMDREVVSILEEVLSTDARVYPLRRESPLLGAIPELDSMAIAALLAAFEERFGFTIDDDELDASSFATVGSLSDFIANKVTA
jgi:acyl carrier protein